MINNVVARTPKSLFIGRILLNNTLVLSHTLNLIVKQMDLMNPHKMLTNNNNERPVFLFSYPPGAAARSLRPLVPARDNNIQEQTKHNSP